MKGLIKTIFLVATMYLTYKVVKESLGFGLMDFKMFIP